MPVPVFPDPALAIVFVFIKLEDCLIRKILEFIAKVMDKRNAETLAASGIDVLALDDDVGMPGTMFISPALWRSFLKPRMAGG